MATIAAIAAARLAVGSLLSMLACVHFDIAGMSDPLVLLRAGRAAASLWRWSTTLDILGYYLLIVPLVLVLQARLRRYGPS